MILSPNVKLNFGLRVLRRRADGFHDLETLFVPYSGFRDVLEIEPAESFGMYISGPEYTGWDPSEDLCARAWRLMEKEFGIGAVMISLVKNSPVGAGLGGGSADAAFTLRALNDIFSIGLGDAELAALAARLGSDCPFFIYNRPMLASGRGEVLVPFDIDLSGYDIAVELPEGVSVSTKEAYAGLHLREDAGESLETALRTPVGQWKERVFNDFEPSVFRAHPQIEELKESMYSRGAVYAAMSGSGSAVFGLFRI